jgi:hypothetical protein
VLCAEAYNKKVAGIISAGNVKPGMRIGQRGSVADGQHPVALTGRVYCWMDAGRRDWAGRSDHDQLHTGTGMKAKPRSRHRRHY